MQRAQLQVPFVPLQLESDVVPSPACATGQAAQRVELRQELQQLALKDLRLRAEATGVDKDAIEDARDGDAPKETIIELILAQSVDATPVRRGGRSAKPKAQLKKAQPKKASMKKNQNSWPSRRT